VTDYTWPTEIIPASSEWRLISNAAAFVSPITATVRTIGRGVDRWACSLTTAPLTGANRSIMKAYMVSLGGQTNRAIITDHSYSRRGTLAVDVGVYGGSQTGSSLQIHYATAASTLLKGDMISFNYELKMVTADVTFDGSGVGVISISPPIRVSPAADDTVKVVAPNGRFMLTGSTSGWSNAPGGFSQFTADFVEAIV
jgi:hypothetical protein